MSIILNNKVCPYGPLSGPIVKPTSWRVLNDNKRFVKDWHDFVRAARRWQYAHPVRKLDAWLWEREKNAWRAWYFSHTPAERRYLLAERDALGVPIFQNERFNKQVKGPRYQRGSILLAAFGVPNAASGATLALASTLNFAINIDFSPGAPLLAGFGNKRDGFFTRTNSSGTSDINTGTDWVTPRTSTVGDAYEVKWNQLTGAGTFPNDENYTEDVWTTISALREVRDARQTASQPGTIELDLGEDGTSTSDVNQDYSIEAGDIV